MPTETIIALPNLLLNPVYVAGLIQPLLDVAEILDEQGRHEHARALRDAGTIANAFARVNLEKSATLQT